MFDNGESEQHHTAIFSLEQFAETATAFREAELAEVHFMLKIVEYHRSGQWQMDGHGSAPAALYNTFGLDPETTRRRAAFGRKLTKMPHTTAALLACDTTLAHARLLTRCLRKDLADAFASPAGEQYLISQAQVLTFPEFRHVVFHWIDINESDAAQAKREDRKATCDIRTSQDFDGTLHGELKLPGLEGEEFTKELKRLEKIEFEKDWTAGRAQHGPGVKLDQLTRAPQERRVAALLEMVRRSAAYSGDSPQPRYVVNVITDLDTYRTQINQAFGSGSMAHTNPNRICRTLDGTPMSPADMLNAAISGRVRKVIVDQNGDITEFGHSQRLFAGLKPKTATEQQVLDRHTEAVLAAKPHNLNHGRTKRFFEGALRTAVQIQHPTCTHEHGCLTPSIDCEIDHVTDWQDGGPTAIRNGKPLCKRHNLWKQNQRRDPHRKREPKRCQAQANQRK